MKAVPRSIRLHDGRTIKLPAVMGVLNVTPDSFSDGGRYLDPERAVEHACEMAVEGAAIIDIGGESTRPSGARAVTVEEELARVSPVLKRLKGKLEVPISIDTRKAAVASAALEAGAAIINDVSALSADPEMAPLAAKWRCATVLMHMRGAAEDHMRYARYGDVVREVIAYLRARARFAIAAGVPQSRVIIDPGIGFSKNAEHNLKIMAGLQRLRALGYPILVGASRKNFVRRIAGGDARELAFGTAAVNALAIAAGASIIRVHEPGPAMAVMRMGQAIAAASGRQ